MSKYTKFVQLSILVSFQLKSTQITTLPRYCAKRSSAKLILSRWALKNIKITYDPIPKRNHCQPKKIGIQFEFPKEDLVIVR